jgi:pimeloyl-ACP methyl ester carboxylesterase
MRLSASIGAALLLCGVAASAEDTAQGFPQSATIPRNVTELWAGFAEFDKATPLDVEVRKAWEFDGVVCRLIRYQVGVFKGTPAKVAAFYAFPKGAQHLPGLLQLHGGGQSASLDSVVADAKRGYASLSLNWGGNKLNFGRSKETYDGPQTDWGKLDATHPPQHNTQNHFAGALTPDEFTLDSVESPRNSNWFVVLMAARRAITLLEQQPEVDPARIGVYGHSMGGKLTTDLAGIDPRVKAAVPSCGGAGDVLDSQTDLPGCAKKIIPAMELACISDNAYIPRITSPVLWLSPANDFHAHIDHMAWNWRNVPDDRVRFSIAPHLNHRHTDEHAITQLLWFEQHLKGAFTMPQTPQLVLNLKTADGVPTLTVTPDGSLPVKRVDIYYAVDPHELTRFWRDALAVKVGKQWQATCPVMKLDQPLIAYANVLYDTPAPYRHVAHAPGQADTDVFALSSRVLTVAPAQLQAAGVKATDHPERLIDDGSRGWHDWYRLNWGHPPLWYAATRKLKDPKWRGPDGAKLIFEIKCATDNTLVVNCNCNAWGAFQSGKPATDYAAVKELKGSPDWQTVSVSLAELTATDPKVTAPLANWQTVTEFSLSPSGQIVQGGQKVKIDGKPWQGPREICNLRWMGGAYTEQHTTASALPPEAHQQAFNDAIQKSIEQEKQDAKGK